VTGGSSGIGAAVARALAAAGAAVVVNHRSDAEAAEALAAEIVTAGGGRALALRADVSDEAEVAGLFEEAERAFGPPDILVANAGLQRDAAFAKMTLAQWREVLDANLTGQFLCALAPRRRGAAGPPGPWCARRTPCRAGRNPPRGRAIRRLGAIPGGWPGSVTAAAWAWTIVGLQGWAAVALSYRRAYELTFAIQGNAQRERRRSGARAYHASQQAVTMAS
jgi:NAD(P)-dependent dehydrogenase (short-subunit alcohol dehydrogenase family)